jgi:hypothetical protein
MMDCVSRKNDYSMDKKYDDTISYGSNPYEDK